MNSQNQIKIADFGVSRKMKKKKLIYEHIGTPAYLAPEIIAENGYSDFKADVWSLGILAFIALTGMVPFKGESIKELNENILTKEIDYENPRLSLSDTMKYILSKMLIKNPKKRISLKKVAEILKFSLKTEL